MRYKGKCGSPYRIKFMFQSNSTLNNNELYNLLLPKDMRFFLRYNKKYGDKISFSVINVIDTK